MAYFMSRMKCFYTVLDQDLIIIPKLDQEKTNLNVATRTIIKGGAH